MRNLFYIFLGGGTGSIFRYLVSANTQKLLNFGDFPVATFFVNLVGCFLIGFFSAQYAKQEELRFLLVTGFCGGFTTFSTFSSENYTLWQNGNYLILFLYIFLSILGGFLAVISGFHLKN